MNVIYCDFHEMQYPVGEYMYYNNATIKQYVEIVKRHFGDNYVMLHCMGSSGAIIAGIIAHYSDNIKINHIKKNGEISHNPEPFKFRREIYNIIVDDFVATGNTIETIMSKYPEEIFDALIVSDNCSNRLNYYIRSRVKTLYCKKE